MSEQPRCPSWRVRSPNSGEPREDGRVKIAYYADDFTGAVDSLLQFRRAGLTGMLSTGVDRVSQVAADEADVVGIAGVARALPTDQLAAEVGPAFDQLAAIGARIVQYKACSTADSSAERGSLGRICEIATERFGKQRIPAVFAQPSFGRYTFFGHHFASEAGQVFRLDRQPTMRNHPVTPIVESDLALHLGAQTALPIESLSWLELGARDTSGEQGALIQRLANESSGIIVCDALSDAHLETIGSTILAGAKGEGAGTRFVLGSGGLSFGLGKALVGEAPALPTSAAEADGPCLVLSGSRSARTWEQLTAAGTSGWKSVDLRDPEAIARTIALHTAGENTILQTTDPSGVAMSEPDIISGLAEAGRECLQRSPQTRLVLCGGDTSGAILRELGVSALTLRAAPWGNVVLCEGSTPEGAIEIVLKGGQMGHVGLLEDVRLGREYTTGTDIRSGL